MSQGVSKGQATRQAILGRALDIASVVGLDGVTIGRLAEELQLSKSGLFAHFGSKEALQVDVIGEASRQFVDAVVAPGLREARGEPRVRALIARWLDWEQRPGGCFFASATDELDDRPGPARDALAKAIRDWLDTLAHAARIAVDERHFRADLDVHQFAFEIWGILMADHMYGRFLKDPAHLDRTHVAVEELLARSRHRLRR